MMKGRIITLIVFLFIGILTYGQSPNWFVNENQFENTMSFVAFLNVDGTNLNSTNDKIAAFANGDCRGTTNLIYVESKGRYYAYLTVFSNTNEETLSFKIYNSSNDQIIDVDKTVNFEINAHYGNLFQAYSFASPALSSEADLLSFDFKDVAIINRSTIDRQITIYVEDGQGLTALNAIFELSNGAHLFSNSLKLESGNNVLDFSNPIPFQVVSEDESKLEEWIISVSYNSVIGNLTFYKMDAVCYNGGAIKILSSESGNNATLFKNQVEYATQNIINGEAVFNNLDAGDYTVRVGSFEKEIIINLKE